VQRAHRMKHGGGRAARNRGRDRPPQQHRGCKDRPRPLPGVCRGLRVARGARARERHHCAWVVAMRAQAKGRGGAREYAHGQAHTRTLTEDSVMYRPLGSRRRKRSRMGRREMPPEQDVKQPKRNSSVCSTWPEGLQATGIWVQNCCAQHTHTHTTTPDNDNPGGTHNQEMAVSDGSTARTGDTPARIFTKRPFPRRCRRGRPGSGSATRAFLSGLAVAGPNHTTRVTWRGGSARFWAQARLSRTGVILEMGAAASHDRVHVLRLGVLKGCNDGGALGHRLRAPAHAHA
jgi:hypothetical protein